jgi:hypothetical protein
LVNGTTAWPIAREIVLQIAVRDIGQLTDLSAVPGALPRGQMDRPGTAVGHTRAVPGTSENNERAPRDPPGDSAVIIDGIRALHHRLDELEARLAPSRAIRPADPPHPGSPGFVPAWRRPTQGETRWPAVTAVAVAVVLQGALPNRLVLHPTWLLPALEAMLLVALVIANPYRINKRSKMLRLLGLSTAALLSLANAWSVTRLVVGLVNGTEGKSAGSLLVTGGMIWLTNVIVFALWYWEFDRGGPAARAHADRVYPDFQFVQMATPQLAPPDWEPAFADYLYLAFTNAAAFSPTDVLPMSRWAKMGMTLQAAISIVTVALVVARAVNILA